MRARMWAGELAKEAMKAPAARKAATATGRSLRRGAGAWPEGVCAMGPQRANVPTRGIRAERPMLPPDSKARTRNGRDARKAHAPKPTRQLRRRRPARGPPSPSALGAGTDHCRSRRGGPSKSSPTSSSQRARFAAELAQGVAEAHDLESQTQIVNPAVRLGDVCCNCALLVAHGGRRRMAARGGPRKRDRERERGKTQALGQRTRFEPSVEGP